MNVKHTYLLIVIFFCVSCQPTHQKPAIAPKTCQPEEQQLISKARSAWDKKDYHTCLKAYQAAYEIHKNDSPQKTSNDVLYIARCYAMLNHKEQAEKYYLKALELTQIAYGQVHERVADIFNTMACFYMDEGRYARAKECAESAHAIDMKIHGPAAHAEKIEHMNTLALIFDHIGAYKKAKELYERIDYLLTQQWGQNHPFVGAINNNLAGIYFQLKHYPTAKKYYSKALTAVKRDAHKYPDDYARTLNNMAVLYKTISQHAQAESYYYSALTIYEQTYGCCHPYVGAAYNNLGGLFIKTGQYAQAESHLIHALVIARQNQHLELLWHVQDSFRDLFSSQKQLELAIFFGKQAVESIETIKSQNVHLDRSLAQSLLTSKSSVFKNLSELLVDCGRLDEAQYILNLMKIDEYEDFMKTSHHRGGHGSIHLFTAEEKKIREPSIKIFKNIAAIDRKRTQAQKELQQSDEQLREVKKWFTQYLDEIVSNIQDTQKHNKLKHYMDNTTYFQGKLQELEHNVAALYYLIRPEKLIIIVTLPNVSFAREYDISYPTLNHLIFDFKKKIVHRSPDYQKDAQKLYTILLGPVEKDLIQAKTKVLMVSLDDTLRYIPLSALYDGKAFVAQRYAVSIHTPAAGIDLKERPKKDWQAVAMGVSKAVGSFNALPAVKDELDVIIREYNCFDKLGVLEGEVFLDDRFNLKTLNSVFQLPKPVIHIATHFKFQPGDMEFSFILLGDGSALTLKMLKDYYYNLSKVDLLTISACETAVSPQSANGQELESFGVMAQKKWAAKSVISTLWKVADVSTGLFMEQFYQVLQSNKHLTKTEALQQIKESFIEGSYNTKHFLLASRGNPKDQAFATVEKENKPISDLNHPFYWAPFILIGNWL
jgi:CHAT domain-containing protein/Tfp pilus assembly protein PilF